MAQNSHQVDPIPDLPEPDPETQRRWRPRSERRERYEIFRYPNAKCIDHKERMAGVFGFGVAWLEWALGCSRMAVLGQDVCMGE